MTSRRRSLAPQALTMVIFLCLASQAWADVNPVLTAGTVSGLPGASVDLSIQFSAGTRGVSALQFDLSLPPGVTYVSATSGAAAAAAGKSVSANPITAAQLRVLVFGLNQTAIPAGELAIIRLQIAANAAPGTWPLTLTGVVMADPNGLEVPADQVTGSFTIRPTNLAPVISSLHPNFTYAGPRQFAPDIYGSNFGVDSVVRWNGVDMPTYFSNSTWLRVTLPPEAVTTPGIANVSVFNPSPNGGLSNVVPFTILAWGPMLDSMTPLNAAAGTGPLTLQVTGSNFYGNSTVQWNGSARPTTYVNSMTMTAVIPAADLLNAGNTAVTVFTPAPGGGTSGPLTFTITASARPVIVLQKSASPGTARPGDAITFTIQYRNTSSGNAANTVITDVVPAGTTLISGSITGGGTISAGTITWNLGTVAGGDSGSVSFQARMNE
jgi:uncharacterized repeat protein (TIGR01451 family)